MPRSAKALSQKLINTTPLPSSGCTVLRDHEQRGLTLRIWPAGTRTWSFEYRSPVTSKNVRLGLPPGSLVEARIIAKSHRATVALGRDPAFEAKADLDERREAHAKAVTVSAALADYETNVMASAAKLQSRRNRVRVLRRAMEGFEERTAASLTRGDLIKRLDQIQVAQGDVSRNRAQSELRHFFGWCRDRDIIPSIPLDRVRRGVREIPRERVLTDDEIRTVLKATVDGSAYSDLVRTLLMTAMRRNEAASMQARDLNFDDKTITVRAEVSKTRKARTIPMPSLLVEKLQRRSRGLEGARYIFGDGSAFERPYSGFSKSFAKLQSTGWTLHDLRRTAATRMHEMGVDSLVIEDLLGHLGGVRGGVGGVYNKAGTLARQREALEDWCAKLSGLQVTTTEMKAAAE